jgi:propanol-preferring alcohol dehydrogenase
MLAVRLNQWEAPPVLEDVSAPEPGPGEVLIDVEAAGLCHTDLHLSSWPVGTVPYDPPFTLGHEVAGVVRRLGPGASGVAEGERVVVYARWGCGLCRRCLEGKENVCERPAAAVRHHGAGLGRDGGLAEQMVVPAARYLVPIGDLDASVAAPLADAGITPYHAIVRHRTLLRPGATALVIGAGGLGLMAVQLLRALSPVRVVVVDRRPAALDAARDVGAHAALSADGLTPEALRDEVGAVGADLVLDVVAADDTLALAAAVVRMDGAIVMLGRGGGTLAMTPFAMPFDTPVTISTWGSIPELVEVVALARAGAIRPETRPYALTDALTAYADLEQGRVVGRAVMSHSERREDPCH